MPDVAYLPQHSAYIARSIHHLQHRKQLEEFAIFLVPVLVSAEDTIHGLKRKRNRRVVNDNYVAQRSAK